MNKIPENFTLANGVQIPVIGLGTWQSAEGDSAAGAVKTALLRGYRHIDTAAIYGNEKSVGRGIRESGISRKEIFVTSKLWNSDRGYESAFAAFEKTLADLGLDYLDLYLIHWPANSRQFDKWKQINLDTWRAVTELYQAGRIRAIGVSNFLPHHLEPLLETQVPPMVDQIEFHPGFMQKRTADYCRDHGILVEAWSPLGTGKLLKNPLLNDLAERYGVSAARLCIRWCLQNGALPLPKSVTESRICENIDLDGFEITPEDMRRINEMGYAGGSGLDPDTVDF
ncbi:MAG: aldo/keto reductase [Succinivibrionaceae bacterium]|nr:aldo/keto reductase [Succinivibrionaceae bacterium]